MTCWIIIKIPAGLPVTAYRSPSLAREACRKIPLSSQNLLFNQITWQYFLRNYISNTVLKMNRWLAFSLFLKHLESQLYGQYFFNNLKESREEKLQTWEINNNEWRKHKYRDEGKLKGRNINAAILSPLFLLNDVECNN